MAKVKSYRRLGADLALTRYTGVPASLSLESADSWGTLDLAVVPGGKGGLKGVRDVSDLGAVSGRSNLGQALIVRLLTPLGSLGPLGHPAYGSRLVELIGQLNNTTTRNLARLYTIRALEQEPRVREILDLNVTTAAGQPDTILITFSVLPLDDNQPLPLALEVTL